MAIREILLLGNPVLRTRCSRITEFADRQLHRTINDLRDTLADFRARRGFGRGIAAPQIGVVQQVVVVNIDAPLILMNPKIARRSRQMMTMWDDCFSFPDILVKVKRHATITVDYQDEHGKSRRLDAAGGISELLQHEIDHVNGILALERAIDSTHIILRSEWNKLRHSKEKYLL